MGHANGRGLVFLAWAAAINRSSRFDADDLVLSNDGSIVLIDFGAAERATMSIEIALGHSLAP